jgi:DNA-binding transcriptional regulator YdaS (Cro superfamily)
MYSHCMKKIKPITQKELAAKLGVHHVYLNAVLRGKQRCAVMLALRIEKETYGKYKAEDLRPDIKEYL